jgi:hypothetical protein
MMPWEDLATYWRGLAELQVYDTLTEQLDAPCLVIVPDEPWLDHGSRNGGSSQTDTERYLAYAVASASSGAAAQRQLHQLIHFMRHNLPEGWFWESAGGPTQRDHQGATYMAAETRLTFNQCTGGDPYEGASSS